MKGSRIAVVAALLLSQAPVMAAEALPPPVGSSAPASQSGTPSAGHANDPGFAADVEHALDDLTTLQCTLLGVLFLNGQACSGQ